MSIFGRKEEMPSIKREMDVLDQEEAKRHRIDFDQSPEDIAQQYIDYAKREWGPDVFICETKDGHLSIRPVRPPEAEAESYTTDDPKGINILVEHWRKRKEDLKDKVDKMAS
ncbi:MAG TPA: hypothetical protein VMU07_00500 [Candidatus Paceibacterota bacterium]|nr:hypothetical protein [Candidatus Paceibacterota bacterium]